MPRADSFIECPESTREEIMRATYFALCEYGYAALTIQRIGKEFPKSPSLIYHHYDGKDELLLDFLSFMLERFENTVPFEDADGSDDHLDAILDHMFVSSLPEKRRQFSEAMVELRAQAAHDERYRDHFTRHDRFFTDRIAAIVASGIEDGVFTEVNPESVATMLVTTFNGSMVQRVTSEEETVTTIRTQLDEYLRSVLLGETE